MTDNPPTLQHLSAIFKSDRLTETDLGENGGVFMDINGNQILTLNRVGMYLVKNLQNGADNREALLECIIRDFAIDYETASSDLEEFLQRLEKFLIEA